MFDWAYKKLNEFLNYAAEWLNIENYSNEDIPNAERLQSVHYQQEIYYDCEPDFENDDVKENPTCKTQGPLHISDVNEIRNFKEFKRALKQVALNSNKLYCLYCQAYESTKSGRSSTNYCEDGNQHNFRKLKEQTDRGDTNPFEIVKLIYPYNNPEVKKYNNENLDGYSIDMLMVSSNIRIVRQQLGVLN